MEKVQVTLVTSRYVGMYGSIMKTTEKKFKIRFWDTGDEAYLLQTSVSILGDDDDDGKESNRTRAGAVGGEQKAKKKKTPKRAKVNKAVKEMLQLFDGEGEDGVTQEEWESVVDKIGAMFI
jgi:hypothetical protein